MPPRKIFDLKSVGKLFDDTLAAIEAEIPTNRALKPEAIEWLKAARYKLMRDVEQAYYQLEASRNTLSRPVWANRQAPLYLCTSMVPTLLEAYRPAFGDNLRQLLQSCGFPIPGPGLGVAGGAIIFAITFAAELTAPPQNRGAEDAPPAQLHIDDEFSKLAEGGKCVSAFAARNFGQLLVDARRDDPGVGGSTSGTKKKRRRPSRTPKDESDPEPTGKEEVDDDERRRLRSVTRATSAATLRSSSDAPRRSSRKKVKQEE
ncbi:hypothetical protein DFH06DRAFT_1318984 [Mycena polygramma]|nr:hypothetical protein DFH06DRAFT_1318984 [Mycena polygramma]